MGFQKKTRVLVVGAGMAGAGAAMYCSMAMQGKKEDAGAVNVTLIDGAPYPANDVASSAGDSRMYRKMYSDPFYAKMQEFALEKNWRELEAMCGEQLLVANGLLFYGEETGETVEGSVLGAKKTMEELGIPFESFPSGKDIDARWAGVRAGDKPRYEGVFEHTAGHARAAPTCNAMVRVARAHGCEVMYHDGLKHLRKVRKYGNDGFVWEATTEHGNVYYAQKVILCLGAWTREFFNRELGLDVNLDIWRVHYTHYEVDKGIAARGGYPQMFCFRKERDGGNDGGLYYAFSPNATETAPDMIGPGGESNPQIKVGVDFKTLKERDTPQTMAQFDYTPSEDVLAMIDDWVRNNMNGIGRRTSTYVAPYSMTRDPYFLLDCLPGDMKDVVVFAGGSGRAFKFGPLLGECLARLALEEKTPIDVSNFRVTRETMGLRKIGQPALPKTAKM